MFYSEWTGLLGSLLNLSNPTLPINSAKVFLSTTGSQSTINYLFQNLEGPNFMSLVSFLKGLNCSIYPVKSKCPILVSEYVKL